METKFNSQICTSRSQSERLLALGLKKETADIRYYGLYLSNVDKWYNKEYPEVLYDGQQIHGKDIPAWSLHRLLEITIESPREYYVTWVPNAYDDIISVIEAQIKEGYFNKEYLV